MDTKKFKPNKIMARNAFNHSMLILLSVAISSSALISCSAKKTGLQDDASTSSLSALVIAEMKADLAASASSSSSSLNKLHKPGQVSSLSVALTDEQIQTLVDAATASVTTAGLTDSADLIALIPEIAEGAEGQLDEALISSPADKMAIINVICHSLIKATKDRDSFLPSASAENGHTPMETVLNKLSDSVISSLDEAGFTASEVPEAAKDAMSGMVGSLDETGTTSVNLEGMIDSLTAGSIEGLDGITLTDFDATDLPAMVMNITEGATMALDDITLTDYSSANLDELVKGIASGATAALDDIVMANYDESDLTAMIEQISGGITVALDDIVLTGYDSTSLPAMLESSSAGVVGSLDSITMTGYDVDDLDGMISASTGGMTSSLDNITMTGYAADDLDEMVNSITYGATGALDDITMTGYDSTTLPTLVDDITSGVTGSLDNIVMAGYDSATIPQMLSSLTAGSTAALGDITMTNYDVTSLSLMVSQISAGSTSSLDDISMTGYSATDLPTMVESITAGSTGALDSISSNLAGYESSDLPDLVESISGGAVASLDNITMTGYDSTDVPDMIKYASSGATGGLADITMTGFDSTDIQSMITAISTGATEAVSDISGTYTVTSDSAIQALAEGVALGATDITDDYPTANLDSTSLATYVETGSEMTTETYTAPTLTTAVNSGLSAPLMPTWGYFMDYNQAAGIVSGFVHIGPAGNETEVESYRLYFGTDMVTKSGSAIVTIPKTGQSIMYDLPQTTVTGVAFLLIYVVKTGGVEESVPFATPFVDMASAGITVSGAMNSMVNGTYTLAGTVNGYNAYSGNGLFLFWESDYWIISYSTSLSGTTAGTNLTLQEMLSMTKMYVQSLETTPPTTGWTEPLYSSMSSTATVSPSSTTPNSTGGGL
jgi:hypothetical protein